MTRRVVLSAFILTAAQAVPAVAAETQPCADDKRIECIEYRPNDVVHVYAAPGETLRIQLGAGEKIAGLHVSDQRTIAAEEPEPQTLQSQQADGPSNGRIASCDPNICRSVVANFVYLMPRRDLTAQPFFLQTEWCNGAGTCQPVPYAFELTTARATPPKQVASTDAAVPPAAPAPVYYGVRFLYPARDAEERQREKAAKVAAWVAAHPPAQHLARAVLPAVPQPVANYRYAFRGAAELKPDQVWDDGRSTFIRFNGLRRVPNVYTYLPDGTETNGFGYAAEPDATGTTLRIGKTAARWCLRDGDRAACIFNVGSDPEGRASPTIAAPPAPASLRSAAR